MVRSLDLEWIQIIMECWSILPAVMSSILLKSVKTKLAHLDGSKDIRCFWWKHSFSEGCTWSNSQASCYCSTGASAVLASLWQVRDEVHDMLLSTSSTGEEHGELLRPISWRWKISEKQRSLNLQSPGSQGPFTWMIHSTSVSDLL